MPPINVLHLRDTDEIGGPGKTILETHQAIDPQRFRLHVALFLTRHENGETPFATAARRSGMPVHLLRGFNQYDPRLVWQVARLVKQLDIQVVHAHEVKSDVIAWLASGLHQAHTVTTLHGWIANSLKARLFTQVDRVVVRRFERVIVVSSRLRDEICLAGVRPENVRLLHNAIVLERYHPEKQDRGFLAGIVGHPLPRPIVVSIGRLSHEKGHADLLDALAIVARSDRSFSLVLVGDGPERERLSARVRDLGLVNRVFMTGYLDEPQRILSEADLLVIPSHTEGLPNVALEALAMEVPVLATAVGGTPEVVEDGRTGRLVAPRSPEALANGIIQFLDDGEHWRRFAELGRQVVEREFSFSARTRMLENVYSELLLNGARA